MIVFESLLDYCWFLNETYFLGSNGSNLPLNNYKNLVTTPKTNCTIRKSLKMKFSKCENESTQMSSRFKIAIERGKKKVKMMSLVSCCVNGFLPNTKSTAILVILSQASKNVSFSFFQSRWWWNKWEDGRTSWMHGGYRWKPIFLKQSHSNTRTGSFEE